MVFITKKLALAALTLGPSAILAAPLRLPPDAFEQREVDVSARNLRLFSDVDSDALVARTPGSWFSSLRPAPQPEIVLEDSYRAEPSRETPPPKPARKSKNSSPERKTSTTSESSDAPSRSPPRPQIKRTYSDQTFGGSILGMEEPLPLYETHGRKTDPALKKKVSFAVGTKKARREFDDEDVRGVYRRYLESALEEME